MRCCGGSEPSDIYRANKWIAKSLKRLEKLPFKFSTFLKRPCWVKKKNKVLIDLAELSGSQVLQYVIRNVELSPDRFSVSSLLWALLHYTRFHEQGAKLQIHIIGYIISDMLLRCRRAP